jgi:hypothetical protein
LLGFVVPDVQVEGRLEAVLIEPEVILALRDVIEDLVAYQA